MIMALSVLFLALSASAQVTITNPQSVPLEVRANKGSTIINAGQSVRVNFVHPNEKGVKFKCYYYEGSKLNNFNVTTDIVGDAITLSPGMPSVNQQGTQITSVAPEENKSIDDFLLSRTTSANLPTNPIVFNNKSTKKWIVDATSGPFAGIALAPNDQSSPVPLAPGLYQFTVIVDQDNAEKSTGKNFSEAVIKFILVQDATEVDITDDNVTPIGGEVAKVILRSSFPEKIVFVGSNLYGRAMRAHDRLRGRATLSIGFNSLSIQFYHKGSRYQADLEFIVAEGEKNVVIGKNNLRNIIKLDSN